MENQLFFWVEIKKILCAILNTLFQKFSAIELLSITEMKKIRSDRGKFKIRDLETVDLRKINSAREEIGLYKLEYKIRKCLSCEKEFKSLGRGNFLCGCKKEE
jgi:hypothetical protein